MDLVEFLKWGESRIPIEAYCDLWNEEFGLDFPISKRLFIQNSIECPHIFRDGSFILEKDGQVAGWIISKITRERGDLLSGKSAWIHSLLVSSRYRGKGYGSKLLELAEGAMQNSAVEKITLGRDIHHYFPGIPVGQRHSEAWFQKRDYQYVNTERDYYRKAPDHYQGSDTDIDCTVLRKHEQDELLSFLHQSFPGRWEYEAWDYFRAGGDGSHFIVARKEDRIIGFIRVNDRDSPTIGPNVYWEGRFSGKLIGIGPLGIDRQYRKKGYGKAIVEAAIQLAIERKAEHLIIDWTGLDAFYKQFGFEVWQEYRHYEKILD